MRRLAVYIAIPLFSSLLASCGGGGGGGTAASNPE
jgi:hypothetical protein